MAGKVARAAGSAHSPEVRPPSPLLVLAGSLLGISLAAPLIRLSSAHPITIAAWRLAIALVPLALLAWRAGSLRAWRRLSGRHLLAAVGAGVLLAVHFWSWNASLRYTSVAASVTLVNLQPAIIAAVSARLLGEPPSRRQWGGILLAMAGAFVVAWVDAPAGAADDALDPRRALLGDALAVLGAITAAGYYLLGRAVRQVLDTWGYVLLAYGAALLTLLLVAGPAGADLWPQPAREWAVFTALAVGPMLLGHTGMNYALGRLPAYLVNLTVLGEPLGATLLAAVLPFIGEVPRPGTLAGGALVLVGVVIAARR
jgi:drug/metabolite transporter (DMT)-like permease